MVEPKSVKLNVGMVTYSFYESDPRLLQYTGALTQRGDTVDVIALNRDKAFPKYEVVNGVSVYRVQSRTVNEKGMVSYAVRILRFLVRSAVLLYRRHKDHPYDLVHVHNVPDLLVFAAVGPKCSGVPVILDIHDILPELFASKFKIRENSRLFRLLVRIERYSAGFASHVIVANHLWRDRIASRSSREDKCSVVRNYPDLNVFLGGVGQEPRRDGLFMITYPGSLNAHQGLDVAIRAFARVAAEMPAAEFHIYGEGPAKSSLIELANGLGLSERIRFHGCLPNRVIAGIMASSDLAIEPKRAKSSFGTEAVSTKILEFMAVGVPVIASKTRSHAFYYDDSMVQYYENDDESELATHILRLKNDSVLRCSLVANAQRYVQVNNWNSRKQEYLQLVDRLVRNGVKVARRESV